MKSIHERYMQRALELARLGQGSVSPNPMVGAVLVHHDRIIGEGWHQAYGGPHAEVNAIKSVKQADISLISKSILYVTLEPCHHFGKTPPCVDLVLAKKIPFVVIAHTDPNPLTSGKSVEKMRNAGVIVELGVLEHEAQALNRAFIFHVTTGRPYIILKWAQTAQGILGSKTRRMQISEHVTQRLVHLWRSETDAILVGRGTAQMDNPRLDLRLAVLQKPYLRIIWCGAEQLPVNANSLDGSQATWLLGQPSQGTHLALNQLEQMPLETIGELSTKLIAAKRPILLVEGGAETLQRFIKSGNWNEIRRITNRSERNSQISEPIFGPILPPSANLTSHFTLGHDHIEVFENASI
jgi:diaminohydroxyphosphoribosylaminopyrimidine deaminase / 5-amino-6-(5-phosphoribosylamino)uracil reductase